jgi:hypothetical protein
MNANLDISMAEEICYRHEDFEEEKQLQLFEDIVAMDDNGRCADCGQECPAWASTNIGVFICIACSGCHRQMGTHVSKVKSIVLDNWKRDEIERMCSLGNKKVNAMLEHLTAKLDPIFPNSSMEDRMSYIRSKYLNTFSSFQIESNIQDENSIQMQTMSDDSSSNTSFSSSPGKISKKSGIFSSGKKEGIISKAKSFVEKRRNRHRRTQSSTDIAMVVFQGILTINLKRGTDLIPRNLMGSSSPYCKIWTGPKRDNPLDFYHGQYVKSKVVKNSLNPEWNEVLSCCVCNLETDALHIKCKDSNRVSLKKEFMGSKSIALKDLGLIPGDQPKLFTIKLDLVKKGELELEISYHKLLE